jgi:SNF2 family DNA or RNA helicase
VPPSSSTSLFHPPFHSSPLLFAALLSCFLLTSLFHYLSSRRRRWRSARGSSSPSEAHRLKNEKSRLSVALREIGSQYRLLTTGTPLQNNLHELWALLNFLLPDIFKSAHEFDVMLEVSTRDEKAGASMVHRLHQVLRPFMLRRPKAAALLPKKETLVFVGMSEMQKKVYKQVLTRDAEALSGNCNASRRRGC